MTTTSPIATCIAADDEMRGAPARAIQELAGHQDLGTTQRYMHLSPVAISSAIRLLDGDGLETAIGVGRKSIR